jgi:hypothetical protein
MVAEKGFRLVGRLGLGFFSLSLVARASALRWSSFCLEFDHVARRVAQLAGYKKKNAPM